jgi:NAD(P)-dependent dehydrogenase (short-subunit alcohol dehydrogenase family)
VLTSLADALGTGRVRVLLHSIALGNLKPLVPWHGGRSEAVAALAQALGKSESEVRVAANQLLADGHGELEGLADAPEYGEATITDEDMAQTIYNMGTSLLTWVQALHQRRMFASDARVFGLTSEGNQIAWRGYAAVSAAKAALESVSRQIAREYAVHGIHSNIIQAGVTPTKALALIPGHQRLASQAQKRNPLGRLTRPADVADVIALLATDEARWINGALLRVDGGEAVSG